MKFQNKPQHCCGLGSKKVKKPQPCQSPQRKFSNVWIGTGMGGNFSKLPTITLSTVVVGLTRERP